MRKEEVVARLREMADLLEITEAGSFEIMAHRNAADSLDQWAGNLAQSVADQTLTEIPAIGKGLSKVITDFVTSGSSQPWLQIRSRVPEQLPELLRLRGLGPKRVRTLWRELGVESPQDLRKACQDGRVLALRGFGAKMVERMLSGLDYLEGKPASLPKAPAVSEVAMPTAPQASGRLWIGMSGYSYAPWKGTFYPEDASPDEFLAHYAKRLATVEINNTFYRFPSIKVVQQWMSQTTDEFRFAVKAHRRITHQLRLGAAAGDRIIEFVERCGQLENRLGCILFQLPPDLARDDDRLTTLLESLPGGPRYAIEFRHSSWICDEVFERLRQRNIACVSGDAEQESASYFDTADFVYVRLRRGSYSDSDLDAWDRWFDQQRGQGRDVLAYLKHDRFGAVPETVVQRWTSPATAAAQEILRQTLAAGGRPKEKRRKKSG